jgi:DNA replication protein DnaC
MQDNKDDFKSFESQIGAILARMKKNVSTPEEELAEKKIKEHKKMLAQKRKAIEFIERKFGKNFLQVMKPKNKQTKSMEILKNLKPGRLGLIIGNPGCGKTFAAASIAVQWIMNGESVEYVRAHGEIQDLIKQTRNFVTPENQNRKDRLRWVENLIIDDVGAEENMPDFIVFLSSIIDYRWSKRLTTVILTNLTLKDWPHRYGEGTERLIDRIREWSRGCILQTSEESLRKKGGTNGTQN